ncbi:hypothetical protein AGMMS4952_25960 [Spirochaetia bacterium]|nr:hypothetical protein AGMMS4952_25960 [Spirochaetia bacterium]
MLGFVDDTDIQITADISLPFFREAGRLKARYRISLADTANLWFDVCAAALQLSATVVTADDEMLPIDELDFFYIPPSKREIGQSPAPHAGEVERELAEAKRRIAKLEAKK